MQQPDRQHYTLLHRLLETGRYTLCQTIQYQLCLELVESSSWTGGPDENFI